MSWLCVTAAVAAVLGTILTLVVDKKSEKELMKMRWHLVVALAYILLLVAAVAGMFSLVEAS